MKLTNTQEKILERATKQIKNDKPELTFGLQIGEYQKLNKAIESLDRCVRSLADNFVSIGYYLNEIKESKVFKDLGFEDIYEFAESKYHFGKTSTKNFINVYLKFGKYDCCPMLQNKYQNYNFSQLVELLPESEEALNKYDPSQTVKEIRLTKFQNSLNEDQSKIEKWLQKDLCSFLKKEYPQTSLKFYGSSYSFFELKYKKYELNFYKELDGTIRMVSYDLKKKFEAKTILSLRLISVHVDLFIKKVDDELKSQTSDSAEEIETNGQTSDRETVEVEVVDAVPDILTSEEKEYLSSVIKPIRDQVCDIYKSSYYYNEEYEEITIVRKVFENRQEVIKLYSFPKDTEFRGMELYKDYTPEELGL